MNTRALFILLAAVAAVAAGCGGDGPLARWTPARSPHETYSASLRAAGLETSVLGRAWLAKADAVLAGAQPVTLPLRETGYFDPATPGAVAYRFDLPRGRRLSVIVTLESSAPVRLFIDLFRANGASIDRVAHAADGATQIEYLPRAAGAYILRLQPELLGGGRYTITQQTEASLRFPVQGASERNIQSVFGDARDGGQREHHGVDIFMPRRTPVVAAAAGVVQVNTTELGGRVVWLYDSAQGQSIYYAHLDDWAVRDGQQVAAGDVLGYVGNTGNARTTAPHLHFGIYSRGPVDPMPFIRASDRPPPAPAGSLALLGEWARVIRGPADFSTTPGLGGDPMTTLPVSTPMRVHGAISSAFRVTLPDGREGFVEARAVGPAAAPIRVTRVDQAAPVRAQAADSGVVMREIPAGSRVPVLGEFNGFWLTDTSSVVGAWVRPR